MKLNQYLFHYFFKHENYLSNIDMDILIILILE